MKIKLLFFVTIFSIGAVNAQFSPSVRSASLNDADRSILDQRLSRYSAFTFDAEDLSSLLHGNGGRGQLHLRISDDLDWTIDLEYYDMRAPDFKQMYTSAEGTFEIKHFELNTFNGRTSENQMARFIILDILRSESRK